MSILQFFAWRQRAGRKGGIRLGNTRRRLSGMCRRLAQCRSKTGWVWLLNLSILLLGCRLALDKEPSTAFFYGRPVPTVLFSQYDRVVVEADNLNGGETLKSSTAQIFAYLSVGEAERWRTGYEKLDKRWFLGVNSGWNSDITDLTSPGWRKYLLEQRMAALWDQDYRGFFLDTLDSYRAVVTGDAEQAAQREALLELIREMHRRFPGVKLLFNRGFELLPEAKDLAVGIVAESLFHSWDPVSKRYKTVDEADQAWLLERLKIVRHRYNLPITVIDYLPPKQRELARKNAARITALGFTPWISNPSLDIIGIGAVDLTTE